MKFLWDWGVAHDFFEVVRLSEATGINEWATETVAEVWWECVPLIKLFCYSFMDLRRLREEAFGCGKGEHREGFRM